MSNEQQTTQGSTAVKKPSVSFANMDAGQKTVFVCKVFVFLISGGFAFPTIFAD